MRSLTVLLSPLVVALAVSVTGGAEAAPKKPPADAAAAELDRAAAASAIAAIADGGLTKCKATNVAKGEGHVMITFTPAGAAASAVIDKGPWVGTPAAKCMQREFMKARVPAFRGDAVKVGKSFHFE